jgi:p-hydroxybenzoate 3-monooxygenase
VQALEALGLAGRVAAQGLVHRGVMLAQGDARLRIDLEGLTARPVTVYGQQEVMRDLFDAAAAQALRVLFECEDVRLAGLDGPAAEVAWRVGGRAHSLACDFVAGCDGQHGVCRGSVPEGAIRTFERTWPFAWLGVLADVPPAAQELIYAGGDRGFALASLRSPTRSRYYLQVPLDTQLEAWPDARFWDEVEARLGQAVVRGPSFEKSLAPLRSAVGEPMRVGRLFLAGDAAHIVPPTGAKGMNLAVADVRLLAEALVGHYAERDAAGLDAYSARALARVWRAQRFSWWFTGLMHRFPAASDFDRRLQAAEFQELAGSPAAQAAFAANYVGLAH